MNYAYYEKLLQEEKEQIIEFKKMSKAALKEFKIYFQEDEKDFQEIERKRVKKVLREEKKLNKILWEVEQEKMKTTKPTKTKLKNLNWAELILLPIEEQKKFLEKLTHSK